MRAVVIGGSGFVGCHLVNRLASLGHEVVEANRGQPVPATARRVQVLHCDVTSAPAVQALLQDIKPDLVVNLAAAVRGTPSELMRVNTWGAVNLVAAAREAVPDARIVLFGSAAEYGATSRTCDRLHESVECSPIDNYGMTKLAATENAVQLSRKWGLRTVVLRPFNVIGAGAPQWSLLGASIRRLREARSAGSQLVQVGRVDTYRDFVAVDDVVAAVLRVADASLEPCVINVCSGTPTRVSDVLALLGDASGRAVTWQTDPALVRVDDIESCIGDPTYARDVLGFSARVSLSAGITEAWRHAESDRASFGEQT